MTAACVFCAIIVGRANGVIRREWNDAIALAPLGPVAPGHTLIIPKRHVADFTTDAETSAATMLRAADYAQCLGECNVITSRGRAATQSVFHLHLHVVPRTDGDGLPLPWSSVRKRDCQ